MMLGNPVTLSLHGVKYLIYHGRSFDDLVATLPTGGGNSSSEKLMVKLLQRRHLAPTYGGKVAVAPEKMDYLVIEDVPDVLHCGHIHIYGTKKYRNVLAVNSGTFQAVTTYMKRKGIRPTPGIVPVLDLKSHQLRRIQFA
jgi:DNA polymerase II small subunit